MIDTIRPERWRLYLVTDEKLSRGRSHLEVAEAAIRGGADVIQLRDKTADSGTLYRVAVAMRKLTLEAKIPLIVNDRLDIALAVDADGLHVGQDDLPASVARRLLGPGKILGVSTETPQEALQAEKDGADYLGVGPIFEARGTKADAGEPKGPAMIAPIRAKCRLPIVAIGGIKAGNARSVLEAGADAVAVISDIVAADDIEQAARRMKRLL
ncbi:MAG: thiamine-phosphate pyrophosphorylase [Deltaproteobacteria bacterium]|nr:thiamine-phosphate pyrophosphorylase [Deltaproteobacteria bacterium]